jgi:hypothetical protein
VSTTKDPGRRHLEIDEILLAAIYSFLVILYYENTIRKLQGFVRHLEATHKSNFLNFAHMSDVSNILNMRTGMSYLMLTKSTIVRGEKETSNARFALVYAVLILQHIQTTWSISACPVGID